MKIAIFSDTYPPQINGVANVAAASVKALRLQGHEVRVYDVSTVISLPFWGYPGERIVIPFGRVMKDMRVFMPDVIHTHTPFGLGWEAVHAAHVLKIPLVGTHHTFFDHYLEHVHIGASWLKKLSWKYVVMYYNQCDTIISPSNALLEAMKQNGAKKPLVIVSNSIDTKSFIPPTLETKQKLKKSFGILGKSIVYMGRLSYEKSIDQILLSFKHLQNTHGDTTLMIIGDGPYRKRLEKMSEELGIDKKVLFLGMLKGEKLVQALQANDIFVTASKSENMPLSVLEAMAVGLPAVGVLSLGIPEIIRHGENGFIVNPDSPQEMGMKLGILLEDQSLSRSFSLKSRSFAEAYGEEQNTSKLEEVYRSVSPHFSL